MLPKVRMPHECHSCKQTLRCINVLLGVRTLVWLCDICIKELGLEVS